LGKAYTYLRMLKGLVQDHKYQQRLQKKQRDDLRKESIEAISRLTGVLLDSVNQGVAQVYTNQQKLEDQCKSLQNQTAVFAKQTQKWLTLYRGFNESLMELGDVKNWAGTMEADLAEIATSLETVLSTRTPSAVVAPMAGDASQS